jgi:hypothetical protein
MPAIQDSSAAILFRRYLECFVTLAQGKDLALFNAPLARNVIAGRDSATAERPKDVGDAHSSVAQK